MYQTGTFLVPKFMCWPISLLFMDRYPHNLFALCRLFLIDHVDFFTYLAFPLFNCWPRISSDSKMQALPLNLWISKSIEHNIIDNTMIQKSSLKLAGRCSISISRSFMRNFIIMLRGCNLPRFLFPLSSGSLQRNQYWRLMHILLLLLLFLLIPFYISKIPIDIRYEYIKQTTV